MPDFSSSYFDTAVARRLNTETRNGIASKWNEVQAASLEKIAVFKKAAIEQQAIDDANRFSSAALFGADIDSTQGQLINDAASFVSGGTRFMGQLATIPSSISHSIDTATAGNAAIEARNRFKQGLASEQDMALLGDKRYTVDSYDTPEQQAIAQAEVAAAPNLLTNMQLLDRAEQTNNRAREITKNFDTSSMVHTGNRDQLGADLKAGFTPGWDQYVQGSQQQADGDLLSGTGNVAVGIAKLLFNAGSAAVNNKQAVLEYALENTPQLLTGLAGKAGSAVMAASNIGYAMDTYQEGIANYAKANQGQMPSAEQRQTMAMQAASLALAEQAGDMVGIAAIKGSGKAVAATSARQALKDSLLRTTGAVTKGVASEAPTEGYQTYMEGQITGKPTTAEDVYVGAAIGGMSGGVLSGGGHAVAELTGGTEHHAALFKQAQEARVTLDAATKANDTTTYLDPKSKQYDPVKAVQVLAGHAELEDTTPEVKQANATQARAVVQQLTEQTRRNQNLLDVLQVPSELEAIKAGLPLLKARLNGTEQLTEAQKTNLLTKISFDEDAIALSSDRVRHKQVLAQLEQDKSQLNTAKSLQEQLTDRLRNGISVAEVQEHIKTANKPIKSDDMPASESSRRSAATLVNLSMVLPNSVSNEAALDLANNTDNGLTTEQREYFREFSAARVAENELMSLKKTSQAIFTGDDKDIGIAGYHKTIGQALEANDKEAARYSMSLLQRFATHHAQKSKLAQDLFVDMEQSNGKMVKRIAQIGDTQVQRLANGSWKQAVKGEWMGKSALKTNGGFTVHNGSEDLVSALAKESEALNQAVKEMQSAYVLKFGKLEKEMVVAPAASTSSVAQTPATPSSATPVVSAVSSESVQSAASLTASKVSVDKSAEDKARLQQEQDAKAKKDQEDKQRSIEAEAAKKAAGTGQASGSKLTTAAKSSVAAASKVVTDIKKHVLGLRKDAAKFVYTADQVRALLGLTEAMDTIKDGDESQWFLLNGKAGTGKTTIVENIVNTAVAKGRKVVVMAPTNKAVMVLRDKLKVLGRLITEDNTGTLHMRMYGPPEVNRLTGEVSFKEMKDSFLELENATIIIDEASMVSNVELSRLIANSKHSGNQFILLGDENQLEPVGKENNPFIFNDKDSKVPFTEVYTLNEVRRLNSESTILKLATLLATWKRLVIPANGIYDDLTVMPLNAAKEAAIAALAADATDTVALVNTNEDRIAINNAVRKEKYGTASAPVNAGEPLIGVFNGSVVVNSQTFNAPKLVDPKAAPQVFKLKIKEFKNKAVTIKEVEAYLYATEDGPLLLVPALPGPSVSGDALKSAFGKVNKDMMVATYAYALTTHKSQGSQWKNVFVLLSNAYTNVNAVYTAITRSSGKVTLGNSPAVFGTKTLSIADIETATSQYIKDTTTVPGVTAAQFAAGEYTATEQIKPTITAPPVDAAPFDLADSGVPFDLEDQGGSTNELMPWDENSFEPEDFTYMPFGEDVDLLTDSAAKKAVDEMTEAVKGHASKSHFTFRELNEKEQALLTTVLPQLQDFYESELGAFPIIIQEGHTAGGTFYENQGVVALDPKVFTETIDGFDATTGERAYRVLIHELAHGRDKLFDWGLSGEEPYQDSGFIFDEAHEAVNTSSKISPEVGEKDPAWYLYHWFSYIMVNPAKTVNVQRELYAQTMAMYLSPKHVELMRVYLPKTYDYYQNTYHSYPAGVEKPGVLNQERTGASGQPTQENGTDNGTGSSEGHSTGSNESKTVAKPAGLAVLQGAKSAPNTPYQQRNLLKDHLYQSVAGVGKASQRPLVMIKDFMSKVIKGELLFKDSLSTNSYTASEQQVRVLEFFKDIHTKWLPVLQQNMVQGDSSGKNNNPLYHYQNLFNFLLQDTRPKNEDGSLVDPKSAPKYEVEENIGTSVIYAAITTVLELADAPASNDDKAINMLLGRAEKAEVPLVVQNLLADVGVRNNVMRNSAGQTATSALGFKIDDDGGVNLMPQLEGEFGVHVEQLLLDLGLIEDDFITGKEFNAMLDAVAQIDEAAPKTPRMAVSDVAHFLRIKRDPAGKLHPKVQAIIDATKGSNNILDNVFSVESFLRYPSLTPVVSTQKTTATGQQVPHLLNEVNDQNGAQENMLDQDMWKILNSVSKTIGVAMAGVVEVDNNTQITKRKSTKAKNDGILRELDRFHSYVTDTLVPSALGLLQPIFFSYDVWLTQRVGIANNVINPQGSKAQRQLFYRKDWESIVTLSDEDMMTNFFLRVGEGFGVKTDRKAIGKSLDEFKALFVEQDIKDDPAKIINQAIADLRTVLNTDTGLSAKQQENLLAAVKLGGENYHTLAVLKAMAQYREAQHKKEATFTTHIQAEVDGVTNGPILAHALFGAAYESEDGSAAYELNKIMAMGGIYTEDVGVTEFPEWKDTATNRDMYENTIGDVVAGIAEFPDWKDDNKNAVFYFTGSLTVGEEGISKAGRDVIKPPVTEMVFGSGIPKSLSHMADLFIGKINGILEKSAKNDPKYPRAEVIKQINVLLRAGKLPPFDPEGHPLTNAMFDPEEIHAMKTAFGYVFKATVKETVETNFAAFMSKRDVFTKVAEFTHGLYTTTYESLKQQMIDDLLAKESEKVGTGMPFKVESYKAPGGVKQQRKIPLRDLTKNELRQLDKKIKGMFPVLQTLLSLESNQPEAGLKIGKSKRRISGRFAYESKVNLPLKEGRDSYVTSRGYEQTSEKPGVGMLPLAIHSLDSFISHMSQMGMQLLNIHDAVIGGLNTIRPASMKMNENTFRALASYSPLLEMYKTMERTVTGLAEMIERGDLDKQAAHDLEEFLSTFGKEDADNSILGILTEIKKAAATADTVKFEAMMEWVAVGQYAREQGSYGVTDADRDMVAARLAEVDGELSEDIKKAVAYIESQKAKILKDPATPNKNGPMFSIDEKGLIKGVTFKDKGIVVINKAIKLTARQLHALRLHEIGVHYGLENMMGAEAFAKVLSDMRKMRGSSAAIDKAYASVPSDTPTHLVDEEALAYLVENHHNSSLVKRVLNAIREWFLKTTGQPLPFESDAYALASAALMQYTGKVREIGVENLHDTPKEGFVKLDFDAALQSSPDMHSLMDQIVDVFGDKLALVGSLALSATKDIYRSKTEQIHDLDFVYNGDHLQLIRDLKSKLPEADLVRTFFSKDKQFTVTMAVPVPGVVIHGVTSVKYKSEYFVTGSVNGGESVVLDSKYYNAVDFFVNPAQSASSPRNYVGVDGKQRTVNLGDADGIFNAKFKMGRIKDIQDAVLADVGNLAFSKSTPTKLSTHDIYTALAKGAVSASFDAHLKTVLTDIVEKLHGSFGSFKASLMQDTTKTAADIYAEALVTGEAVYADKLNKVGILLDPQQSFVAEQVYATVLAAMSNGEGRNEVVYRELGKLFNETRSRIKPKDFYKGGNWATALPHEVAEAEAVWDHIFNSTSVDKDGRSTHLAEFAALGLASEEFNKLLKVPTKLAPAVLLDRSISGMLIRLFNKILEAFNSVMTRTEPGQDTDKKLEALVKRLIAIEDKRKRVLETEQDPVGKFIDSIGDTVRVTRKSAVSKIAHSSMFMGSKNVFIAAASSGAAVVAESQVRYFFTALEKMRNDYMPGIQGIGSGFMNEMNGPKPVLQSLLRAIKTLEKQRKFIISQSGKFLMGTFESAGENLSPEDKKSITKVLLHTGAHVLLDYFDTKKLETLLTNKADLQTEIDSFQNQLNAYSTEEKQFFIAQSKALGFYLVHGRVTVESMLKNANNIARMYTTTLQGKRTEAEIAEATKLIDALSSLYALSYTSDKDKSSVVKTMGKEHQRTDGNGIEVVLKFHKQAEQESKERLFSDSEALMVKGYVPEIYNPRTDIKVANAKEGALLELRGYEKVSKLETDPSDIQDGKALYVLKNAGAMPWLSGMFSFTGMRSKGTKHHGNRAHHIQQAITQAKQPGITALMQPHAGENFDPTKVVENYMTPLLNDTGAVVNYQYLMHSSTKDVLLERDTRFDAVLGMLAGSIFDKQTSAEHNRNAVKVLHEEYVKGYTKEKNAFMVVSASSSNPELREIYQMLPQATKDAIREIWGKDEMLVRTNALDITFGYRKLSLSSAWDTEEEDRDYAEKSLIFVVEKLLMAYGMAVKHMSHAEAEKYSKRGAVMVQRGEGMWQEVAHEVKDILVMKTGFTAASNIGSNLTLLKLFGVSNMDALRDMQIAWVGAENYTKDSERLFTLETQLSTKTLTNIKQVKDIEHEISQLKDSLARNPVAFMIKKGLMPTIVEDVSADDDIYSYKKELVRRTEKYTNKLNKHVKTVGKQLYMAHDTKLYKAMSHITQYSDFVARYALYQHLTKLRNEPLTEKQAIQVVTDAFVSYDVPMNRKMQYLDDHAFVMFTKYFVRIQRVIRGRFKYAPGRTILLMLTQGYLDWVPSIIDSSILFRFGNNPFSWGALQFPGALDELATVKAGMSLFK